MNELQCIMPIANIPSVMEHGILCHNLITDVLEHTSVAMETAQEKRAHIKLPDGAALHDFANVYFHARNPMLYKRRAEAPNLSILRVSQEILKIKGIWVSDGNAASAQYTNFYKPEEMHEHLNFEWIYAERWSDGFSSFGSPRKLAKCAEVLVPVEIPPQYLQGAYVVNKISKQKMEASGFDLPIQVNPYMFFKGDKKPA